MAGKVINTHEATVKTLTVEVKTLVIGGRQVTLSVFRQLLNEPVVDMNAVKLNGVPWGRVHYFPDKHCERKGHLHVVWQKGGELRRSCVDPPNYGVTFREERQHVAQARHADARQAQSALMAVGMEFPGTVTFAAANLNCDPRPLYLGSGDYTIDGRDDLEFSSTGDDVLNAFGKWWGYHTGRLWVEQYDRVTKESTRRLPTGEEVADAREWFLKQYRVTYGRDLPTAASALAALVNAEAALVNAEATVADKEDRYAKLYADLAALDQLFIAT